MTHIKSVKFIELCYFHTALYREIGERGNEMENSEYERKKEDDLQKRLSEAHSRIHHLELVCKDKVMHSFKLIL